MHISMKKMRLFFFFAIKAPFFYCLKVGTYEAASEAGGIYTVWIGTFV